MFSALGVLNPTPIFSFSAAMLYEFGLFSCNGMRLVVGLEDLFEVLLWARQYRVGTSMAHAVFELPVAATICWLWRESNGRIFQQQGMDCSSLQGVVIRDIQDNMSSWRGITASPQNLPIAATWSIPRMIFSPKMFWGL